MKDPWPRDFFNKEKIITINDITTIILFYVRDFTPLWFIKFILISTNLFSQNNFQYYPSTMNPVKQNLVYFQTDAVLEDSSLLQYCQVDL